jgi:hypothetical protein
VARFTITALVSAVLTTTAFGADPALLSFVMPDAKVVAGAYVDRDVRSPLGQFLISQINANGDAIAKVIEDTGIDPTRDIQEVIVSSNGTSFIAAAKGRFDPETITAKAKSYNAQISTYNGVQLLTGSAGRSVALLDTTYAIAGNTDAVQAAIDRRFQPASFDAGIAAKVKDLSAANDAWFVTTQVLPPALAGQAQTAIGTAKMIFDILQSIQMVSGGVVFGSNVDASATAGTATGNDAQSLAMLIQLGVVMAQMSAKPPELAQAAALLATLKVAASASTVTASISIPEAQLEQAFQAAMQPIQQQRGPSRRRR